MSRYRFLLIKGGKKEIKIVRIAASLPKGIGKNIIVCLILLLRAIVQTDIEHIIQLKRGIIHGTNY